MQQIEETQVVAQRCHVDTSVERLAGKLHGAVYIAILGIKTCAIVVYETVVIGNGVEYIVNPTLAKLGLAEEELRKALERPWVVDIEVFHVGNLGGRRQVQPPRP